MHGSFLGTETKSLFRSDISLVLHVGGKMGVHNENKVCQVTDSSVKYNIKYIDMVQMK
jgi:hypothetical protein